MPFMTLPAEIRQRIIADVFTIPSWDYDFISWRKQWIIATTDIALVSTTFREDLAGAVALRRSELTLAYDSQTAEEKLATPYYKWGLDKSKSAHYMWQASLTKTEVHLSGLHIIEDTIRQLDNVPRSMLYAFTLR